MKIRSSVSPVTITKSSQNVFFNLMQTFQNLYRSGKKTCSLNTQPLVFEKNTQHLCNAEKKNGKRRYLTLFKCFKSSPNGCNIFKSSPQSAWKKSDSDRWDSEIRRLGNLYRLFDFFSKDCFYTTSFRFLTFRASFYCICFPTSTSEWTVFE